MLEIARHTEVIAAFASNRKEELIAKFAGEAADEMDK